MQKIKMLLAPLCASLLLSVGLVGIGQPVYAQTPAEDACSGIEAAGGTCDTSTGAGGFEGIIRTIISVLSIVVGAVSVIMIIVGGFRYVISGGDSNATKGAKDTIMYAVIGLVLVIFAQAIVAFVWTGANEGVTECPTNRSIMSNHPDCSP